METFNEGDRVVVFDSVLYKDDKSTPLSYTMRPATVVCWYGEHLQARIYPSLIDVKFDHRPAHISKAHFTEGVKHI